MSDSGIYCREAKKPFSFSREAEKKRDIRSYQIPFPASFPNLFSPFGNGQKKVTIFPAKVTIKNVYTILTLRHSTTRKSSGFSLLKQPVVKKGKLCAKLLRAPRMEKHIKKIENDIIIMRLQ